ncbi:hypothetical protein HK102_013851 [Quaeritorhiza haematococci]|nr:hypothetical protein HK102_013851 [Quaeritorhiza haematococci]
MVFCFPQGLRYWIYVVAGLVGTTLWTLSGYVIAFRRLERMQPAGSDGSHSHSHSSSSSQSSSPSAMESQSQSHSHTRSSTEVAHSPNDTVVATASSNHDDTLTDNNNTNKFNNNHHLLFPPSASSPSSPSSTRSTISISTTPSHSKSSPFKAERGRSVVVGDNFTSNDSTVSKGKRNSKRTVSRLVVLSDANRPFATRLMLYAANLIFTLGPLSVYGASLILAKPNLEPVSKRTRLAIPRCIPATNRTVTDTELETFVKFALTYTGEMKPGELIPVPRCRKIFINTPLRHGLYVREEFLVLRQLILDYVAKQRNIYKTFGLRAVVTGSPGVGKSAFAVFWALHLIRERKNIAFVSLDGEKRFVTFRIGADGCEEFEVSLEATTYEKHYALIESKEAFLDANVEVAILFANPWVPNFRQFRKAACTFFYMSPWGREELADFAEKAGPGLIDRDRYLVEGDDDYCDSWEDMYKWVGGIPRYVFRHMQVYKSTVTRAVPTTLENLKDLIRLIDNNGENNDRMHMLFHFNRDLSCPLGYTLSWASEALEEHLEKKFGLGRQEVRDLLKRRY